MPIMKSEWPVIGYIFCHLQQMCIQDNVIYPVDSNPLFSPLDVDEEARPLEGCVLSIR